MERPKTARLQNHDEDEGNKEFKSRPSSRREARIFRQGSSTHDAGSERIFSRGISTVSSQDGSNWRPASGIARIQGTASRLLSAATQHRGLSVAASPPVLDAQMNVMDRLITQQGLSSRARSSGTGLRGPGKRQVLDKRYYEGLLQMKIQELSNEISVLHKDTENCIKEREDFMVYDRQNKERAKELTELQSTLADYNFVMDKLHTGVDVKDIEAEYQVLKMANDAEQSKLEQMFKERSLKQQQIHQLEEEIKKERSVAEKLMESMSPEMRDKYASLSGENVKLQKIIDQIQHELDVLAKKKDLLEQQILPSPLKQEAVKAELKLLELEEKRSDLLAEENENDPNSIQQKYLNQVKEDNAEIATMERSLNQLQEELKNYEKQLEQVEQDLEECQSERHRKYIELRKREETIESFLSTYEDTKQSEKEKAAKLRKEIVEMMAALSEHLLKLPATQSDFDLLNKELPEIDGSDSNDEKLLHVRYKQKQLYFEKLQGLEVKLRNEVQDQQKRIQTMESEIAVYENLDALKDEAEKKRFELLEKKRQYLETRDATKEELQNIKKTYDKIRKELQENETYKQLQALERKLALIEQDNFDLKEYIAEKKSEMNYSACKEEVVKLVSKYNQDLKNKYKHGSQEI